MMFIKKTVFTFIGGILAIYAAVLLFDFGFKLTWVDIPLHFAGGMAVAMFAAVFFQKEFNSKSKFFILLFLLGSAAFVGTLWEFMEWGIDNLWGIKNGWPRSQPSLDDTMLDYLMDLSGAFLVSLMYLRKKN